MKQWDRELPDPFGSTSDKSSGSLERPSVCDFWMRHLHCLLGRYSNALLCFALLCLGRRWKS